MDQYYNLELFNMTKMIIMQAGEIHGLAPQHIHVSTLCLDRNELLANDA